MKQETTSSAKQYLPALIWCALAVLADQFTKWLAVTFLKDQEPFVLIPGVFEFRYLENRGAAFGIFQGKQYLFLIGGVHGSFTDRLYLRENPCKKAFRTSSSLRCACSFRSSRKYDRPDGSKLCCRFFLFQPDRFPNFQCRGLLCCDRLLFVCFPDLLLLQR